MQIPCVYIPGPAPAVSVANSTHYLNQLKMCTFYIYPALCEEKKFTLTEAYRQFSSRSRLGF
jgi:hypothetical protein